MTMPYKEDMFKHHKPNNAFDPQTFGDKPTENSKYFLSSFNNYCKFNPIVWQEKILVSMFLRVQEGVSL